MADEYVWRGAAMVKVGFIVEGFTEKVIIESDIFNDWAKTHGLEVCGDVINAKGGGNLLPQNIVPMVNQLQQSNPDHIVILTDLEEEPSEDAVRQRIGTAHTNLIFIAVKAIEAWFLADSAALKKWLAVEQIFEEKPEQTTGLPWIRLKEVAASFKKQGPGSSKPGFAMRMVKHYGFSIEKAAQHPACPSAKRFHDGLIALGQIVAANLPQPLIASENAE
jgi:hypothetical protein